MGPPPTYQGLVACTLALGGGEVVRRLEGQHGLRSVMTSMWTVRASGIEARVQEGMATYDEEEEDELEGTRNPVNAVVPHPREDLAGGDHLPPPHI